MDSDIITTIDMILSRQLSEQEQQIKDIQTCIMRLEGQVRRSAEYAKKTRESLASVEHLVQLHGDDIREIMALFQALALRISRIEEHLGITEPVVVPGD